MSPTSGQVVSAGYAPSSEDLFQPLRSRLAPSDFVFGVFGVRQPEPEGVLQMHGGGAGHLRAWLDGSASRDPLWRDARKLGLTRTEEPSLLPGRHVLTASLPASLDHQRFWWLAVARDSPFDRSEELEVSLALRKAQVLLDWVEERGMSRLWVGEDDRLLHADPDLEARLLTEPAALGEILAEVRPVLAQRWPKAERGFTHDMVLPLPTGPTWVRCRQVVPLEGWPGHVYLELRPVGPDDPPAVGVLPDERLASALAFLSDHYRESPGLNVIAAEAHISPFHFHRLFSKTVGVSPKHYLLRLQLMIAKWQLRTTHRPVRAIAGDCGFASHGHFTATFHRLVGLSPTGYREREGSLAE